MREVKFHWEQDNRGPEVPLTYWLSFSTKKIKRGLTINGQSELVSNWQVKDWAEESDKFKISMGCSIVLHPTAPNSANLHRYKYGVSVEWSRTV